MGDELCALDAKMDIDDNALYRHQEFEQISQYQDVSPVEALAKNTNLVTLALMETLDAW